MVGDLGPPRCAPFREGGRALLCIITELRHSAGHRTAANKTADHASVQASHVDRTPMTPVEQTHPGFLHHPGWTARW